MAKKKEDLHAVAPVLRVAPLGQLNVYTITEDELNSLRRGSPGSLFLNIGLALAPVSFAFLITILSTSIPNLEGKIFFIAGTLIFGLAGATPPKPVVATNAIAAAKRTRFCSRIIASSTLKD